MRDTESMLTTLGVLPDRNGASVSPNGEDEPRAVDASPTSTDAPGDAAEESISLDEAWAELDGEPAPQNLEAADAEAQDAEPDEVERLRAERDALLAEKAVAEAAAADAAFEATWSNHRAYTQNWYEDRADEIQALGERQGRTQADIDAAIYQRVMLGRGLTDPATGRPQMGYLDMVEAITAEEKRATRVHYTKQAPPDAVSQLATKYALDEADQIALKKFVNRLSPQELEEMASTFGAKNARLSSTQQQAKQDAVRNVSRRLTNSPGPGTPSGPAASRKAYEFTHDPRVKRAETEYVLARGFGLRLPPSN